MGAERVELAVGEITINDGKLGYIGKRKIEGEHVAYVLEHTARYYRRSNREGGAEYSMLGPTANGRYLLVAIAHVEGDTWRLITAYWLDEKQSRRLYERQVER